MYKYLSLLVPLSHPSFQSHRDLAGEASNGCSITFAFKLNKWPQVLEQLLTWEGKYAIESVPETDLIGTRPKKCSKEHRLPAYRFQGAFSKAVQLCQDLRCENKAAERVRIKRVNSIQEILIWLPKYGRESDMVHCVLLFNLDSWRSQWLPFPWHIIKF